MSLLVTHPQLTLLQNSQCITHIPLLAAAVVRLLPRANTNTNALIALPSNLLIPRTVSSSKPKVIVCVMHIFSTMVVLSVVLAAQDTTSVPYATVDLEVE